ncbi:transmembrane emp24 domain-containing protein 5-like [Ornithodoros turicata]|uniref:transmembrane emp24 domain-containing protein 5-like n=1 Tax=Ornithodoros turicata TaxID=34597 RepID=UPI0031392F82
MAMWAALLAVVSVLVVSVIEISADSYISDSSLGTSFEFKLHVDAGREECFYQNVEAGASVYVAFQVLRGGDGQAGFAVRHPNGNHVLPYQWKPSAEYEETSAPHGGFYELCIDNSLSHFAAKVVSLYFNSFKRDKWEAYVQEIEALGVTVDNFTAVLQNVDGRVGEILKYSDQNRRQLAKDWYVVDSNNRYVQNWSLAQCVVIIATSAVQVYFVRKLFEVKKVTPTSKPRA